MTPAAPLVIVVGDRRGANSSGTPRAACRDFFRKQPQPSHGTGENAMLRVPRRERDVACPQKKTPTERLALGTRK